MTDAAVAVRPSASSTNPKDSLGVLKVSFGVCPSIARVYWALAMMDGAGKYGEMNWRNGSVSMCVYLDAIDRHLTQLRAGEDLDPDSEGFVPHTGRIMACCSIIEDARSSGHLLDDRRVDDHTADLLRTLTAQNYSAATLATTRTPAKTIDEARGGPINFEAFVAKIAEGQSNIRVRDAARKKLEQAKCIPQDATPQSPESSSPPSVSPVASA